jgi:hypothetical protein
VSESRPVLAVAVCLASTISGACGQGTTTRFAVEEGKQYCEVVTVPTAWAASSPGKQWLGLPLQYRWPADSRHEILVSPEPQAEVDLFTDQKFTGRMLVTAKYRISLSPPIRVTAATEMEWNAGIEARRWPGVNEFPDELQDAPTPQDIPEGKKDPREFRHHGRLFDRSGNIWDLPRPVLFSPARRYVALQSWDGWYYAGKAPYSGRLYIDLYDAASGKALARVRGKWSDWTPAGSLGETYWLTENDLILPFDWDLRNFLVCHLP